MKETSTALSPRALGVGSLPSPFHGLGQLGVSDLADGQARGRGDADVCGTPRGGAWRFQPLPSGHKTWLSGKCIIYR